MTPDERNSAITRITSPTRTWKKVRESEATHQATAGNESGNGGVGNLTIFEEVICE